MLTLGVAPVNSGTERPHKRSIQEDFMDQVSYLAFRVSVLGGVEDPWYLGPLRMEVPHKTPILSAQTPT